MNKLAKDAIGVYLTSIADTDRRGLGVSERSYYPALGVLLDSVGKALGLDLKIDHEVKDQGAGHPDFEIRWAGSGDLASTIEAKGFNVQLEELAISDQAKKYLRQRDPLMITNLRSFALIEDANQPSIILRCGLPEDPAILSDGDVDTFTDFMQTVLQWRTEIRTPRELAQTLARYARESLRRLEMAPPDMLDDVRMVLDKALGLTFERTRQGDHFFRSSLVQTLFYGLFSAWVAWNQETIHNRTSTSTSRFSPAREFRASESSEYLRLPFFGELYERINTPRQLNSLTLRDPVAWAEAALQRTPWPQFEATYTTDDAVNYFYEPFLEAFDPKLREDLGVWYTPREIVRYMVRQVDRVLVEELGIADGLADPNVVILDPCCGTGAYLLETLRFIQERLTEQGQGSLVSAKLRQVAAERVFGFEILPAPFVIAQMRINNLLTAAKAGFSKDQRARVYLTNALTGWKRGDVGENETFRYPGFPELSKEAAEATNAKRDQKVLVVLGNPPYNGFNGTVMDEEREMMAAYRAFRNVPAPRGRGLSDLYARFYRVAERRIVEQTGRGVVCFISNSSWLTESSFSGMRERYMDVFDRIWIDNLNGDKYRTGKLTPEGKPDPSIFSSADNPEGIQVGTAISLLVRREHHVSAVEVAYRDLWGKDKRSALSQPATYEALTPEAKIGLPFAPRRYGENYLAWPSLPDLIPKHYSGVNTARDVFVIDIDRDALIARMKQYFDPKLSDEQIASLYPSAMQTTSRFDAKEARSTLLMRGFLPENIMPYTYRAFDHRWIYWEPKTKLIEEKRADYLPHLMPENGWLEARQRESGDTFNRGYVTRFLADKFGNGLSSFFPIYYKNGDMLDIIRPNVSVKALAWLDSLHIQERDTLFYHVLAVMHTPLYRSENDGALRQDWPRIPLAGDPEQLRESAALGKQIAALLESETAVRGITSGSIRSDLRGLGAVRRKDGSQLDPSVDFILDAGWGSAGRGDTVMPGTGTVVIRPGSDPRLGDTTYDIYLNDQAYWENIPADVWHYALGGYPVIKKWLSYRESKVLGRPLRLDEVEYVTSLVRRIAALLLIGADLDASYSRIVSTAADWSQFAPPGGQNGFLSR